MVKMDRQIEDYPERFTQLIGYFQYRRVVVTRLSYGSWLFLALASEMPAAIATVIMLDAGSCPCRRKTDHLLGPDGVCRRGGTGTPQRR